MDRYERILTLHRTLQAARYPIPVKRLMEETGASRATLYRDIAYLRDVLGAPVDSHDDPPGYRYDADEGSRFELPGLWLSSEELHALLVAHQLLSRTGPDVLSSALAPLQGRIETLLAEHAGGKRWPIERIRVTASGTRRMDEHCFRTVATAVLDRKQLRFGYRARSTNAATERTVSPQRLTHYRDNWYLDAWDHGKDGLRSFALDRMSKPTVLDATADDVTEEKLDQALASSYGIFSGEPKDWATIRFSAKAARWVADEHWHSRQEGKFLDDGRYELRLPYSNSRELLMDLLRYGPDAEIVSPPSLREEARIMLKLAIQAYGG
ncbi:MAG: YafY family transcriptional regulator [Rhodanobacteraceae bacterium]|nr:YafY family transcriptional regulator [Xanthomonadales bacterium]MCP5479265.1 YafY family transcriptional regulator [Rhodanobacteraceae bacterium]HPF73359.1 YafY family protein [Xanthomonadaceae bacterium]HRX98789.1 YafY family protein [Xanthomonadaceae bacterium]